MASRHTIIADIEKVFVPAGLTDQEVAYPKIKIVFIYTPGAGPTGPSYASGGDPGYPAEVEFVSAGLIDGDGLSPTQEQIDEWAEGWLSDDGYQAALDEVIADHERNAGA